jgi:hypothetical protein
MTLEQFKELTLEEMIQRHDGWYMMSDDHSKYEQGVWQRNIIEDRVASQGGWTKDLVEIWNKSYNPKMELNEC